MMYKSFLQLVMAVALSAGVCPVEASEEDSDLEGRAEMVRGQLMAQQALNRITGQDHTTLIRAINSATDEQCEMALREFHPDFGSDARGLLIVYNEMANVAKHDFSYPHFAGLM